MTGKDRTTLLERALLMHLPMNSGSNTQAREAAAEALGFTGFMDTDSLITFAEARGHNPTELWPQIMELRETPQMQMLLKKRSFAPLRDDADAEATA